MKTEMKMIAAVLAVLAVALGGVYVLDDAQAANEAPAIWPSPEAPGVTAEYEDWEREANWQVDEATGVVYWEDVTEVDGTWITILNNTQVVVNGKYESFSTQFFADPVADMSEFGQDNLKTLGVKFYNLREGTTITSSNVQFVKVLPLENPIETESGTLYVDAIVCNITMNILQEGSSTASTFTAMNVKLPIVLTKYRVSAEYEFEYTYNGLYQSPIADLNDDNGNASDLYYEGDSPVPYINLDDCLSFADLSELLPEGMEVQWVIDEDSTSVAVNTNKFEAMVALKGYDVDDDGNYVDDDGNIVTLEDLIVPYVITIVPADDSFVIGKVTVTWWIVPLSLSDIEFDIRDPYYDYDEEVRPKVIMKWYEPEDGPNEAKVHYILPEKVDIEYIMPEDYDYDMPSTLVPAYEVDEDEPEIQATDEDGNLLFEDGEELEELQVQSKDEYGRLMFTDVLDITETVTDPETGVEIEVFAYDTDSEPVMETVYVQTYEQATDPDTGDLLYEQATDADGNPLFRQWRYEDGTFAYYQLVGDDGKYVFDEDGNPVYNMDDPIMVPVMVPKMVAVDTDEPAMVPVQVPVMVPNYKLDEDGNLIPLQQETGKYEQLVIDGVPQYEQKKYEDGSLVWEQMVTSKGKPVFNEDGTPVYDETKPVFDLTKPIYDETKPIMEQVYDEVEADFTATQRGYPYGEKVYDYGIHIVADTGFYEFDTADYKPAVDEFGEPVYAQAVNPFTGELEVRETMIDGEVVTLPVYDEDKPLADYGLAVVDDEDNETYYLVYVGELYDAERFVWHILPIPIQTKWIDFDDFSIVVPAEATWYWNFLDEDNEPVSQPDEDYTIVPMGDEPAGWPFAGQYYFDSYGAVAMLEFPEGANFTGGMTFKNIAIGGMLNMDEIEVVDGLDAKEVEDLKKAVHLYALNLSFLKPFGVDDFNITVLDGDGDLIVYQDRIIRTSLDSDMYSIVVSGNMENGFYGSLFGFFSIERGSSGEESSDFTTDGKGMITGYTGDGGDVVIPAYIGDEKIVGIADKAFANNKTITSLVVGNNVKTIGMKAFYGCSKLKTLEIGDSVRVISYYAFYGCKNLESVAFGHGLKAVRDNAFSVDFLLMGQDFKRGMTEIPPYVDFSEDGIYVYANYIGDDGKAKYLAESLVGNVFVLKTKGVLELFPPIDFGMNGYNVLNGDPRESIYAGN